MSAGVTQTLRIALAKLRSERTRINSQILALEQALRAFDQAEPTNRAASRLARKRMSAAARKAISQKLKAYWAKRKKAAGKKAG